MSEDIKTSKNGQWKLEKAKWEDDQKKAKNRARFFAQMAEEMKAEKEKKKEEDRINNIRNPFTGEVDRFNPEDPKQANWKEHIKKLSESPLSNKPDVDTSSIQLSPQMQFQQRQKAMQQSDAKIKANHEVARKQHMEEIFAGRKQPATMWEKAALVSHMKQKQAEQSGIKRDPILKPATPAYQKKKDEQTKQSTPSKATPKPLMIRRKDDMNKSDMAKADYEMDMSNLIELLHHIKELKANLQEGDELPDWVSAKLTLATDYLSRIAHYVDAKKEMDSPLNKTKIDELEKALKDLKKEEYWQSKTSVNQIARQNQKVVDQYRQKNMGVGVGSGPSAQISSAPRVSGVAKEYQLGTTKSGKPIMSWPEHHAHNDFSEADHGQAAAMHKQLRDELRQDRGANPKLAEHHHNAAEFHSKMQAKLRASR